LAGQVLPRRRVDDGLAGQSRAKPRVMDLGRRVSYAHIQQTVRSFAPKHVGHYDDACHNGTQFPSVPL